jgi:hypothetical protein
MPTVSLPLGGHFYESDSLPISAQECINLYLNVPQAIAPTQENLFSTPGTTEVTTAGTNTNNRGSHVFQGTPYVVNGDTLYRIDRAISATGVVSYSSVDVSGGTSISGNGIVIMDDNGAEGAQICIVAPDVTTQFNTWIYTVAGGLVLISDGDFLGPATTVKYIDGYFLFTKQNTQKWFISNLRDGLAYTATDFASAEADPDSVVGAFILHNEPYIFGTETFEPYQNIGGAGFPFQRVQGGVQRKGLKSKYAVTQVNDVMYFLGAGISESPSIYATDGGRPQKISTTAIDTVISSYSDTVISNCYVWNYSDSGHEFIAFNFPDLKCFVYDISTGRWATRESKDLAGSVATSRIKSVIEAYGVLLVMDSLSNKVGLLEKGTFTEYTNNIVRTFVTPQIDNEGQPFFIDALELWGEAGVGLTANTDPDIQMSMSTNGGRSYNNSITRNFGKLGEYNHRTIWNSLGRIPREVCFKFTTSAPVKWVFSKVEAQIE